MRTVYDVYRKLDYGWTQTGTHASEDAAKVEVATTKAAGGHAVIKQRTQFEQKAKEGAT